MFSENGSSFLNYNTKNSSHHIYITEWWINCLCTSCNRKDSAAEAHDNGPGEISHQTQSEMLKRYC